MKNILDDGCLEEPYYDPLNIGIVLIKSLPLVKAVPKDHDNSGSVLASHSYVFSPQTKCVYVVIFAIKVRICCDFLQVLVFCDFREKVCAMRIAHVVV